MVSFILEIRSYLPPLARDDDWPVYVEKIIDTTRGCHDAGFVW